MSDFITVLTATGKRLAKVLRDDGSSQPYDDAAYFLSMRQPVNNLDGLHKALQKLRSRTDSCVIRGSAIERKAAGELKLVDGKGQPVDTFKGDAMRRRLETFPDVPHHWLMLDVDDESWSGDSFESGLVEWVAANLPECFHDASFVWQLSSSAGIKPGLRAHLWFWLSESVGSLALREWGKAWNEHKGRRVIDTSIYSSVQAHYTADPIIDDPFGLLEVPAERLGMYEGLFSNVELRLDAKYAPAVHSPETEDDFDLLNQKQPLEDIDEDEARKYLDRLDNDLDGFAYDDWLKVGMALKHQFGEAGFELFDEWSQRSAKYDAHDCERRWKSFQVHRANAATFSSIIHMAGGRIKPDTPEEVKASYEDLVQEIEDCTDQDVLTGRLVKKIGAAGLSDTRRATLLEKCRKRVKELTGVLLNRSRFTAPLAEEAKKGKALEELHIEVGLARMVLAKHFAGGKHLKLIAGNFWLYQDGVWSIREPEIVKKYASDALQEKMSQPDASDRFAEMLLESDRTDRLGALVDAVVKIIGFEVTEVDRDPLGLMSPVAKPVINCTNGEVWFSKNGDIAFRAHDPKNNLVQQIACEYDQDAECPTWDAAVDRVFRGVPNKDAVIAYWYELLGYIIQPTRSAGEAWMLMKGPGGNGKSFLLDIVQTILGDAATAESMARLSKGVDDHFTASLVGKLLLVDDDFKAKGLLPDDWMKKLTGQKQITANPKYQRQYSFLCRTMVVILSNGWPATSDTTEGMQRRANVFEVNHILSDDERDPQHRVTVVEKELPGVLNRLVQGWQRVLRGGGKLRPPKEVLDSRDRWLSNGSTGARFLADCIVPTFDTKDRLLFKDVWSLYKRWMIAYEEGSKRLGRHGLLEQAHAFGLRVVGVDGHSHSEYFEGWAINEAAVRAMTEAEGL